MKLDGDAGGNRRRCKRHPLFRDAAQDGARIGRVGGLQIEDALRNSDRPAHGLVEKRLFGLDVAEEGGRRDAELAGDIGERGSLEALQGEEASGRVEDLIAGDTRWTAHL